MISPPNAPPESFQNGDEVFIPFWIVLEHLDATPPTPFVKSRIIHLHKQHLQSPAGPVEFMACDLELGKPGLVALSLPVSYLIKPEQLVEWANRLADWFRDYPRSI